MVVEVGFKSRRDLGATHYTQSVLGVVQAVLAGRMSQWPNLVTEVHALAISVCERQQAHDSDFANNVALRVIERLQKDNYRALHRFVELRASYPDLDFEKWTRGIINNAAVDELRSQPNIARSRTGKGRELRSRVHIAFEDENHAEIRVKETASLDARRILRWMHSESFPDEQRHAVLLWLTGHSVHDCASLLGVDVAHARRCLQAARLRLRRHFKEGSK